MAIAIREITGEHQEFEAELNRFALWWGDIDEAGVREIWAAFDGEALIGFATTDADGRCVAIEVLDSYQGQGIGSALVEAAGCYQPADNQCPGFWAKFQEAK
jgi:GNAT superfamily N-acetyltransferase